MNKTENKNAITTAPADAPALSAMSGLMNPAAAAFFCSIPDDGSRAAKIAIYNAINSAGEKVDDHMGEVLEVVDVAAHGIQLEDENTGELRDCVRVVLVDKDSVGYAAVSDGIVSSLTKIFQILGAPHWDEPVKMKPVQQKTRAGYKTTTIELV